MFGLHNCTGVPNKVISECKFSVCAVIFGRWALKRFLVYWNFNLLVLSVFAQHVGFAHGITVVFGSRLSAAEHWSVLKRPTHGISYSSCLPNQHRSIRKWHKHKHTLSTKKENRHEPNCKYFHAECGVFNMRRVFVQSLNTTVIYVCFQCSLSISKKTSCLGGKRRVHRSLVRTQITFYFK